MVLKLPTLLEGEALAVWLELMEEVQKDYVRTKKIIDATKPMSFISLDDFHLSIASGRTIVPVCSRAETTVESSDAREISAQTTE